MESKSGENEISRYLAVGTPYRISSQAVYVMLKPNWDFRVRDENEKILAIVTADNHASAYERYSRHY